MLVCRCVFEFDPQGACVCYRIPSKPTNTRAHPHPLQVAHFNIVQTRRNARTCADSVADTPMMPKGFLDECFSDYQAGAYPPRGTYADGSGAYIATNNFATDGARSSLANDFILNANLTSAFECTDRAGLPCEAEIEWYNDWDRYGKYEKSKMDRGAGYKLEIDLGIFQFGKPRVLQTLADAQTAQWLDRQTRRVTAQLVTVNANIEMLNVLEVTFMYASFVFFSCPLTSAMPSRFDTCCGVHANPQLANALPTAQVRPRRARANLPQGAGVPNDKHV